VKIFVISHNSFSLHNNNGKTLQNLFLGLGPSEVFQLYFQDEIPESNVFYAFYRIRDLDIAYSLLPFFQKKMVGTKIKPFNRESVQGEDPPRKYIKQKIINTLKKNEFLKHFIRNWLYDSGRWYSDDLSNWIFQNKPTSIFFLGGNSTFSFKIARSLARLLDVPIDIYITDDYVLNSQFKSYTSGLITKNLLSEYKASFQVARHVFVIGDLMAKEFSREFNRPFIPLINPARIPDEMPLRVTSPDQRGIKIVYAGGLHLGRDLQIVEFAKILDMIRRNFGEKINFLVYSRQPPTPKALKLFLMHGINFMGSAEASQLDAIFSSANFLLHVESFDSQITQLTKLSISTKIPEYLASGALLIAYGPPELASIKIIADNNIGYVIAEPELDSSGLERFHKLLTDKTLIRSLSKAAFSFANQNFSINQVQSKLYNLLKDQT
jgi:glycosyltransferase involved in cell wall biosynthesis